MENIIQTVDTNLNSILDNFVKKPTLIRGAVHLLLMLYAAKLAPTPPKVVLDLFDNVYFKLFAFSLILWTARFSPSTSILLALAFMVTINYSTTGKIWEMLENTSTELVEPVVEPVVQEVSATESAAAVQALSSAASSPTAISPEVVAPVLQVALANVTTQEGAEAIKVLAIQATTPEPGTPENVAQAVEVALVSIAPNAQQSDTASAIVALADAAASPEAAPAEKVAEVANVAVSAMTTEDGVKAVQALAQQAVVPESGSVENINAVVKVAAQSSGCYPLRNYDMSKVSPMKDGNDSFEDYQTFTKSL